MRDFKRLHVWHRAHDLVLQVFSATERSPRRGAPGLTGQLRRAAMAIPTNIAEGCGCESRRDYARFLGIATASAVELEYLLQLAGEVRHISPANGERLRVEAVEVRRMCRALRQRVLGEEGSEQETTGGAR